MSHPPSSLASAISSRGIVSRVDDDLSCVATAEGLVSKTLSTIQVQVEHHRGRTLRQYDIGESLTSRHKSWGIDCWRHDLSLVRLLNKLSPDLDECPQLCRDTLVNRDPAPFIKLSAFWMILIAFQYIRRTVRFYVEDR